MKLLVCGSRTFNDFELLSSKVTEIIKSYNNDIFNPQDHIIISGGANGADNLAEKYADGNKIKKIIHLAEWDKFNKQAGYIRNRKMIDENPDIVIAFWDGKSKGTAHTIHLANEKGIKLIII